MRLSLQPEDAHGKPPSANRVEASTRKKLRPAGRLARHVLLPPLLGMVAVLCLLVAVAISFGQNAKATHPLAKHPQPSHDELARQLTTDLEGTPSRADIRRAQKPLSERRRLLLAHPYFELYSIAKRRFDVSLYLLAAVHYQETGFGKAPEQYATYRRWTRHRNAVKGVQGLPRPTRYPHKTKRHPHTSDDFDVVMAIAAGLKANGSRGGLGKQTARAIALRYGATPEGRLSAAMVLERARAWQLLGTLPLPGRGELATPVKGVVGGCGYFGCPRPGHLHNGVDFLAPTGVPIHAADVGIVASAESAGESGGYGNFVCVQHRPSLASCYAHMSAFAASIRPGARVRRGQVIGLVGSTGSSTAPHLHFEVRRGPAACSHCAVDPLPLLSGDVPETVLPKMVDTVPVAARAASVVGSGPVVHAPAAAVAAPPGPAATSTASGDTSAGPDADDPVPDPPIDATIVTKRPAPTTTQAGGSRPADATTQRPAPAPTPAQQAPAPAASAQPAPSAPAQPPADTGTGGSTPDLTAAPPPPPPAAPPAADPAAGGG